MNPYLFIVSWIPLSKLQWPFESQHKCFPLQLRMRVANCMPFWECLNVLLYLIGHFEWCHVISKKKITVEEILNKTCLASLSVALKLTSTGIVITKYRPHVIGGCFTNVSISKTFSQNLCIAEIKFQAETMYVCPKHGFGHTYKVSA